MYAMYGLGLMSHVVGHGLSAIRPATTYCAADTEVGALDEQSSQRLRVVNDAAL